MYCGHTGAPLEALIFFGPTYYQRLKHMVDDKLQSRTKGPIDYITRQPVAGKVRSGGIRFGEMERDTINAHGGAAVLLDRLLYCSDRSYMYVCEKCGEATQIQRNRQQKDDALCMSCGSVSDIHRIQVPGAWRALHCELGAMCVKIRYKLKK